MFRKALFALLVVPTLFAQSLRPPTFEDILRKTGLRVAPTTDLASPRPRTSHEFRLRWNAGAVRVTQRIERNEPPPRQRSSEIGEGQLVVVVLDRQATVRAWQIVQDPRILRGEFPDANGNLRMRSSVDF